MASIACRHLMISLMLSMFFFLTSLPSVSFAELGDLSGGQIQVRILKKVWTDNDLYQIAFNYGFVLQANELMQAQQGTSGYETLKPHIDALEQFRPEIKGSLALFEGLITELSRITQNDRNNILIALGVLRDRDNWNSGSRSESELDKGRRYASDYIYRYPWDSENRSQAINDFFDSHDPKQLFGEFYPQLIKEYEDDFQKISQVVSDVADQERVADQKSSDRSNWINSAEGKKYSASQAAMAQQVANDQAKAIRAQELEKAKEFPFYAEITCTVSGNRLYPPACFQGNIPGGTEIELRNGEDYGLYKNWDLPKLGKFVKTALVIDLREHFSIKAQPASNETILGVRIVDRVSERTLFNKQTTFFEVISVSN